MAVGAAFINAGYYKNIVAATGSHFSSAERQYRYPLELGCTRPPQAQWTVTGAGGALISYTGGGNTQKPTYGSTVSKLKTTAVKKDLSVFKIGVSVEHPKFGKGTIVGVRGSEGTMILDIAFAGLGIKQLSASLAPLTVV